MPFRDSSPLVSTLVAGLVLGGLVVRQTMPESRVGPLMFWVGAGLVALFVVSLVLDAASGARAKARVRSALERLAAMGEAATAEEAARLLRIVEAGYVDRAVLASVPGLVEAASRPGPQRVAVLTLGLRHGSAGEPPWSAPLLAGEGVLRAAGIAPADLELLDRWIALEAAIRKRRAGEAGSD